MVMTQRALPKNGMGKKKKKKRRLKIVTTALLHMVACASDEKYCSGCDLAEQVLRQDKRIDALLCQGVS